VCSSDLILAEGDEINHAAAPQRQFTSPIASESLPIPPRDSLPAVLPQHLGEPGYELGTTKAAEEALPQMASREAKDWDKLIFREPKPGQFWAPRSTPWIVPHGPMRKPPREFALDYPDGALADEAGNLLKDIDGNDLIARNIAGRRKKGEKDQGLKPDTIRSIIENDLRIPILRVAKSDLPDRAQGEVLLRPDGAAEWIKVWERLPKDQSDVIVAHEFAHIIDALTGRRRTYGHTKELDRLYSENMTGKLNPRQLTTPKSVGYDRNAYRRERMAEAIRTAIVDPNTLKTVAPKTARFLRDIINKHPIVSRILQINEMPVGIPLGLGATLATAARSDEAYAGEAPWQQGLPVKTSSERNFYPRNPKVEGFRGLVRALAELETKPKPQFYGGSR